MFIPTTFKIIKKVVLHFSALAINELKTNFCKVLKLLKVHRADVFNTFILSVGNTYFNVHVIGLLGQVSILFLTLSDLNNP